uniref:Uncharacterized protein n=1 Tax=Cacopsylla melanoneura TaxID=428564 RepID=A0A8D8ZQ58_9HEMI
MKGFFYCKNTVIFILLSKSKFQSFQKSSEQTARCSTFIRALSEHRWHIGESLQPILLRCWAKQSCPVIRRNVAPATFLGNSGIMSGLFILNFFPVFISSSIFDPFFMMLVAL